jgi:predicted NBD/HSP70 family sugar kinase
VVTGGVTYRGASSSAGEWGHTTLVYGGRACRCGARGCLEQVAGQEAILRAAGLSGEPGTSMGQPRGSVAELLARARSGDRGTIEAIEAAGRALGIAVAAAVNLLAPSTVVLGGLYTLLDPWLHAPLEAELRERVIRYRWSPVRVLPSRLGPAAAVRGAAGAVVREVLSNPAAVLQSGTPTST